MEVMLLQVVVMDNGEIICEWKTVWRKDSLQKHLRNEESVVQKKRKTELLEVTTKVLDMFNGHFNNLERVFWESFMVDLLNLLSYDDADQDVWCLADDLRTEFGLEE